MNNPLYGQIIYISFLCNHFLLKLQNNSKLFFIEMMAAVGKNVEQHVLILDKINTR
jgi:hypothetical protein